MQNHPFSKFASASGANLENTANYRRVKFRNEAKYNFNQVAQYIVNNHIKSGDVQHSFAADYKLMVWLCFINLYCLRIQIYKRDSFV